MARRTIALDADGVLLDFHLGYAAAWTRAFGHRPVERDPLAYWPIDRWQVERLDAERRVHFRNFFDLEFWSGLPAVSGSLDACISLHDAGFELVCVSALDAQYESARLQNLRALGFPIECVIATGNAEGDRSPKAAAIESLQPALSLHGHIHEARGSTRLGRTLCINPGSSYEQGQLLGAVVDVDGKKKVKRFVLTSG